MRFKSINMYVNLHDMQALIGILMIAFDVETNSTYVNGFCCNDKNQNVKKKKK